MQAPWLGVNHLESSFEVLRNTLFLTKFFMQLAGSWESL